MCDTTPIGVRHHIYRSLPPTTDTATQSTSADTCQSVRIPPAQLSGAEPSLGALRPQQVCWPVSRTESPNRRIRVLEERVCLMHSNIATFISPSVETSRTYPSGKVQARLWFSLKQTCLSGPKWFPQTQNSTLRMCRHTHGVVCPPSQGRTQDTSGPCPRPMTHSARPAGLSWEVDVSQAVHATDTSKRKS